MSGDEKMYRFGGPLEIWMDDAMIFNGSTTSEQAELSVSTSDSLNVKFSPTINPPEDQTVYGNDSILNNGPMEIIVKFHGAFMMAAWIVLLPLSMLILDNYHETIPRKLYFQIYRPMRLLGLGATLISFCTMLTYGCINGTIMRHLRHFIAAFVIIGLMLINTTLIYIYQARRKNRVRPTKFDSIIKPINVILTLINDILAKQQMMNGMDIANYPKWASGCILLSAVTHGIILITLKVHQLLYTPKKESLAGKIFKFNIVEDDSVTCFSFIDSAPSLKRKKVSAQPAKSESKPLANNTDSAVLHVNGKIDEETVSNGESEVILPQFDDAHVKEVTKAKPNSRGSSPARGHPKLVRMTSTVQVLLYNKFRIFLLHFHAAVMLVFTAVVITGIVTFGMHN